MLSTAAFNAFLKTLEEPPAYAKFILATTEKHKIIPTILSRCQIFDFRRIGVSDIAGHLDYVSNSEKIEAEEEALHVIAQKSDGALRDALSTFDQIVSFSGDKITYKDVIENLNILDFEYYFRATDALVSGDISTVLLLFNEVLQNGFDGQDFLSGLSEHFRNLLVVKNPRTASLFESGQALRERYENQARICSRSFLFRALELVNQYDLNYKTSNNKRLHVEIALTQLSILNAENAVMQETAVDVKIKEDVPRNQPQEKKQEPSEPKLVPPAPVDKKPEVQQKSEPKTEPPVDKPITDEVPITSEKNQPEKVAAEEQPTTPDPLQKHMMEKRKAERKPAAGTSTNGTWTMRNISIKGGLQSLKAKKEKETAEEPVIINEFSQEQLDQCWDHFIDSYKDQSPSFVNSLAKARPKLGSNFEISYEVPHVLITKDSLNNSILLNYLKTELKNNQITLKPSVTARKEQREAYTDRERFDEMLQKYSGMSKLKDALDLELD
jgi:DNA polymerase-3 subunit gamma/tau